MSVLLLILGLFLFVGLVVVHEFGHFIMARRGGVEVEEFGIGFPPQAKVLTKKNGTVFTLNWLPLGGFVKLKGENDADKTPGSFGAARLSTKVKIMLAGVAMNLATAFVLLTLLAFVGTPRLIDNQFTVASDTHVTKQEVLVGFVEPGSPAEKAGLQPRDRILGLGNESFNNTADCASPPCMQFSINQAGDLRKRTEELLHSRQATVLLDTVHNGKRKVLTIQPRSLKEVADSEKTHNPKGYLGIVPTEYVVQRSTWSAPIVAAGFIKQVTVLTFKGLGTAIAGVFQGNGTKASSQVSGPVGVFVLLKDGSLLGYQFIVMIIAIISLTLAIMNALPIPALDGGRLFVTLLFRAVRRPLRKKTENLIHGTGFAALMLLFVLITIVDVRRFF